MQRICNFEFYQHILTYSHLNYFSSTITIMLVLSQHSWLKMSENRLIAVNCFILHILLTFFLLIEDYRIIWMDFGYLQKKSLNTCGFHILHQNLKNFKNSIYKLIDRWNKVLRHNVRYFNKLTIKYFNRHDSFMMNTLKSGITLYM